MLTKGDVVKWPWGSSRYNDEALNADRPDPNVGVVTSTEEWPLIKVLFNDGRRGTFPQDELVRLDKV